MARIMPALKATHSMNFFTQGINNLAFTLITPLQAKYQRI
jgi:hypothetical protein